MKQHATHFVKICNDINIEGNLLVKQFIQSL